jgi:hypothetical protein
VPSHDHVSPREPYAPKPPNNTTDLVNGSNAMLTSTLGDGATIRRAVMTARTRNAFGTVDVDEVTAGPELREVDAPQPTTNNDRATTAATTEYLTATSKPDPPTTTKPRQAVPEPTKPFAAQTRPLLRFHVRRVSSRCLRALDGWQTSRAGRFEALIWECLSTGW